MMSTLRIGSRVVIGVMLGALALGACSGGGSSSSSSAASASRATESAAIADDAGVLPEGEARAESLAVDGSMGVDLAEIAPGLKPLDGRDVIRTAGITVRTKRVGDAAAEARAIVAAAGGTTFSEQAAFGARTDAILVFKVPPDQFRTVLDRLGELGRTRDLSVSTEDVTEAVVDLESRLASATASRNRLQGLFGRAGDVGEIVALETALAQREAEVESLEGQLRVVQAQVDEATIALTLAKLGIGTGSDGQSTSGFLGGLERGWDAMVASATVGATALGAVLPFLVLGGVALGVVVIVRARHPRHTSHPNRFGVTTGE